MEEPNKAKTVCEGPRTKKVQEVTTDTAVEPNVKKDGPNNKTYRRKALNRSEKTSVIHHTGGVHNCDGCTNSSNTGRHSYQVLLGGTFEESHSTLVTLHTRGWKESSN